MAPLAIDQDRAPGDQKDAGRPQRARGAGGFYLVAALGTVVSADTSWRFFRDVLHFELWERFATFLVLEVAFVACGWAVRANVRRPDGKPGAARLFALGLCGFSAYMAIAEAGFVAGIGRVALGPVIALIALHLALGIEIRVRRGGRTGTWAKICNELRERFLSRLGLGDDTRKAVERTRDRARDRAARLASGGWAPFRRSRLARAVRASGATLDEEQRARLVGQVAALQHLDDLRSVDWPSPWRPAQPQFVLPALPANGRPGALLGATAGRVWAATPLPVGGGHLADPWRPPAATVAVNGAAKIAATPPAIPAANGAAKVTANPPAGSAARPAPPRRARKAENPLLKKVARLVAKDPDITGKQIAARLEIPERTAYYYLSEIRTPKETP